MLISFTIFHKGGLVLYQYFPEGLTTPTDDDDNNENDNTADHVDNGINGHSSRNHNVVITNDAINRWISQVYLNPTKSLNERKAIIEMDYSATGPTTSSGGSSNSSAMTMRQMVEWYEEKPYIALAMYPDLRRTGGGGGTNSDNQWIPSLLRTMIQEFQIFVSSTTTNMNDEQQRQQQHYPPMPVDTTLFDKTFALLFKKFKTADLSSSIQSSNNNNNNNNNKENSKPKPSKVKKGGKEKRQWHDGNAKVTKEAMDELDFSKSSGGGGGGDDNRDTNGGLQDEDRDAVALAEARAAYLPSDTDLADFELTSAQEKLEDDDDVADEETSWGGSLKSLFQQATGQKILTKQDLQEPLKHMHTMLTSKNVATDIAQHICENVESSLVGKKLSSMYRVKTAVRQALERAINKLLLPSSQLDLLRQVTAKRDALFGTKRPYVIVVVGINGVGKSTSLAKLAFFLKTNGCKPLLAACDTFRSGAVEQLSVHARCLDLPIFHQGYSKDPSTVAKAAIEQAMKEGNDVVLVDTAGRMQNNVPLMKALGKLAAENQPDLVVFVGEALVGNDGVDQVRMFNQAVMNGPPTTSSSGTNNQNRRNQKVNAILLTKFDTVSDKVGAALTMTHVTNAPILFVGTGQKYHHLQKLSTPSVIRSLFK